MEPRDMNSTGSARDGGYRLKHSDAASRLRRALAAVADGQGSPHELQHAAHELVTELRQANQPPEQMLLRIKEILAEAGMRPTYASPELDGPVSDNAALYRDVIAWSIRSYYGDGDGASNG
jgi:hypothetical protein